MPPPNRSELDKSAPEKHVHVEIQDITKIFKGDLFKKPFKAVDRLNLKFIKGQTTGLLGHNGAGKTTTIRMLLGLIFPDSGRILFEGEPLTIKSKQFIGYMPEVNKLPLSLTCEEILRLTLALRGAASSIHLDQKNCQNLIDQKLADLGLLSKRHKKVKELSKGLARRLAFAQATIHKPTFLILDEPTSGLDPAASTLLENLILEEKRQGTTILLCTHELTHLSSLCDEAFFLRQGRLALSTLEDLDFEVSTPHLRLCLKKGARLKARFLNSESLPFLEDEAKKRLPRWGSLRQIEESLVYEFIFLDPQSGAVWLQKILQEGHEVLEYKVGVHLDPEAIAYLYSEGFQSSGDK